MKSHSRNLSVFTTLVVLMTLSTNAQEIKSEKKITVHTLEPQTVLYTLHRGPHADLGQAFGELYGLAGSKNLHPLGPAVSVHLNNPQQVKATHWLTEIRIPVAKSALSLAGTLGPMTDVKTIPAIRVAVTVKPAGVDSPEQALRKLYRWIVLNGHVPVDAPRQRIVGDNQVHDYQQMTVEVMVPVAKVEDLTD